MESAERRNGKVSNLFIKLWNESSRHGDFRMTADWKEDMYCIPLAQFLEKETEALSLNEIIERTGLARKTVFRHLKHLVEEGILIKKATTQQQRGRPLLKYYRTQTHISILTLSPQKRRDKLHSLTNERYEPVSFVPKNE